MSWVKYGCERHCTAVGLLFASYYSIFSIRSMASALAVGNMFAKGVPVHLGKSTLRRAAN